MKNPQPRSQSYITSLKSYAIFAVSIFIFSVLNGCVVAIYAPDIAFGIMENLRETFSPLSRIEGVELAAIIFANNTIKALLVSYAAPITLGIVPLIALWINGVVVGVIGTILYLDGQISTFIVGVTPHGILEIPALIMSGAVGFRLTKAILDKILRKKISLIKELKNSSLFFAKIIIPLLIGAALIETFITPFFLGH